MTDALFVLILCLVLGLCFLLVCALRLSSQISRMEEKEQLDKERGQR